MRQDVPTGSIQDYVGKNNPEKKIGCVSFFCTKDGGGKIQGKNQERDESMKAKKNTRERSPQMRAP